MFCYIKPKGLSIFLYTKMQIITPLEIWYSCGFAVTLGLAAAVPGAYARSPAGEHIAGGQEAVCAERIGRMRGVLSRRDVF